MLRNTHTLGRASCRVLPRARQVARRVRCSADPYSGLLEWVAGSSALKVRVADLGQGMGRGLVAAEDLAADEQILSVPLTRVFQSQESELHWAAEMACRLLAERHAHRQQEQRQTQTHAVTASSSGGSSSSGSARASSSSNSTRSSAWGPWLRALPATAPRTPLQYSPAEVQGLGCPSAIEEVEAMQEAVRACYEEVEAELSGLGCGWDDFLWAVEVLHSRCFYEPTLARHLCVPGVDMANHSETPSARVRIQHSPDSCQGCDAVAEVAEPPPPQPSRFMLLAGDGGIRAGEEVTISYGPWPNEALLLLFGFVPRDNPHDALVLFRDAADAVNVYAAAAGVQLRNEASAVDHVESSFAETRFVVTREGLDARLGPLLAAVQDAVHRDQAGECVGAVSQGEIVAFALQQCNARFEAPQNHSGRDGNIKAFAAGKAALAKNALAMLNRSKRPGAQPPANGGVP